MQSVLSVSTRSIGAACFTVNAQAMQLRLWTREVLDFEAGNM